MKSGVGRGEGSDTAAFLVGAFHSAALRQMSCVAFLIGRTSVLALLRWTLASASCALMFRSGRSNSISRGVIACGLIASFHGPERAPKRIGCAKKRKLERRVRGGVAGCNGVWGKRKNYHRARRRVGSGLRRSLAVLRARFHAAL